MLVLGWRDQDAEARRVGSEGIAMAREAGDKEILAFLLNDHSRGWTQSGNSAAGIAEGAEAVALFRELGNRAMLTDALATQALARFILGELDAVVRLSDEAFAIADAIGNPWGRAFALFIRVAAELERGDWGRAIELGEVAMREGAKAGFVAVGVWPRTDLALAYELSGAPAMADEHLAVALADSRRRMPDWLPVVITRAAAMAARRGDLVAARTLRTDAEGLPGGGAFLQFLSDLPRAIVRLCEGDLSGARDAAQAGRERNIAGQVRPFTADFDVVIADASIRLNDLPAATVAIERGLTEARALGSQRALWDLLVLAARCADLTGDPAAAREAIVEAASISGKIAASLQRVGLEQAYRARPEVAAVLARAADDV